MPSVQPKNNTGRTVVLVHLLYETDRIQMRHVGIYDGEAQVLLTKILGLCGIACFNGGDDDPCVVQDGSQSCAYNRKYIHDQYGLHVIPSIT